MENLIRFVIGSLYLFESESITRQSLHPCNEPMNVVNVFFFFFGFSHTLDSLYSGVSSFLRLRRTENIANFLSYLQPHAKQSNTLPTSCWKNMFDRLAASINVALKWSKATSFIQPISSPINVWSFSHLHQHKHEQSLVSIVCPFSHWTLSISKHVDGRKCLII